MYLLAFLYESRVILTSEVTSLGQSFNCSFSLLLIYRLFASAAPSAPPQNLAISFNDSKSLLVSWQPPPLQDQNGVIRNYSVSYRIADSSDSPVVMQISTLTVTLVELAIFTEYEVSVRAITIEGQGPPVTGNGRTDSTGNCISDPHCYSLSCSFSNTLATVAFARLVNLYEVAFAVTPNPLSL